MYQYIGNKIHLIRAIPSFSPLSKASVKFVVKDSIRLNTYQ